MITGVAALALLAATASLLFGVGVGYLRRDRPLDFFDVAWAFLGLIGISSLGAVAVSVALTGSLDPSATPDLAAAVLGTALGQIAVGLGIWARGQGDYLGFRRVTGGRLLGLPVALVAVFLLFNLSWSALLSGIGVEVPEQQIFGALEADSPLKPLVMVFVVGVAPLCEELLFRGLLQRVLTQRAGLVTGVVGSGLSFGLLHLSDPASVPPLIGLGLGLALLRARTGSLWPAVVAHTLNNGLAMALVLSGLA